MKRSRDLQTANTAKDDGDDDHGGEDDIGDDVDVCSSSSNSSNRRRRRRLINSSSPMAEERRSQSFKCRKLEEVADLRPNPKKSKTLRPQSPPKKLSPEEL